ncbi:MAG: hypothetical protein WDW38_001922 [Sanguina aurantia]
MERAGSTSGSPPHPAGLCLLSPPVHHARSTAAALRGATRPHALSRTLPLCEHSSSHGYAKPQVWSGDIQVRIV